MPSLLKNFIVTKKAEGDKHSRNDQKKLYAQDKNVHNRSKLRENDDVLLFFNLEYKKAFNLFSKNLEKGPEFLNESILFSTSSLRLTEQENNNEDVVDGNSNVLMRIKNKSKMKSPKCIARMTSSLNQIIMPANSVPSQNDDDAVDDDVTKNFNEHVLSNKILYDEKDLHTKHLQDDTFNSTDTNYTQGNEIKKVNYFVDSYFNDHTTNYMPLIKTFGCDSNTLLVCDYTEDVIFEGKCNNKYKDGTKYDRKETKYSQKSHLVKVRNSSTPNLFGIAEEENESDFDMPYNRSLTRNTVSISISNLAHAEIMNLSDQIAPTKTERFRDSAFLNGQYMAVATNSNEYPNIQVPNNSLNNHSSSTSIYTSLNSPKSSYSSDNTSLDSVHDSGFQESLYKFKNKQHKHLKTEIAIYQQTCTIIENVLKLGSSIYSSLNHITNSCYICQNLILQTKELLCLLNNPLLVNNLNVEDIQLIKELLLDVEKELNLDEHNKIFTNYFIIILRRTIEEALQYFAKIICQYFVQSSNNDKLLHMAVEHFIHLILFCDDLCSVAIQYGILPKLLFFSKQPTTKTSTTKLLLRAMAVLCGVTKGCLQLIENNGLAFIIDVICQYPFDCSVEAAGVLTQLTSPSHSFVTLPSNINLIVSRLTDMSESCHNSESLLLCTAALTNLSSNHVQVNELIHERKSCLKLVHASTKPNCGSIFVYEQLVTLMARVVSHGWYFSLYNDECVSLLLDLILITDEMHTEYCERIKYKASVTLGSIAKNSLGLSFIYNNKGYGPICKVTESNPQDSTDPMVIICQSIRDRLENEFPDDQVMESSL
uniref:WAPL domain-containing protein n=1 Tax=Rhabditophanes sp. KR3021 TaxID=114890 RepID=A0AC35U4V4_9BILA